MINKVYEHLKKYIKENYKELIILIIVFVISVYPLNYVIYVSGGTIDIDDRIKVNDSSKSEGSYNLAYVSEIKATIPTVLLSYVIPTWEKESLEVYKAVTTETQDDINKRSKMFLEYANQVAIKTAYEKANKVFEVKNSSYYVTYKDENTNADIKVGDKILKVGEKNFEDINDIAKHIQNKDEGSIIKLTIERNNKIKEIEAAVKIEDNRKIIGIGIIQLVDYETNPKIEVNFKSKESGSSGGLMMTLAIYDKLIDEDLTKGKKIVGTGTIESDGTVGQIDGIKYKLSGAVKEKADIFIAPAGDNYEECIKIQKEKNYKIKIISASTFDEVVEKLKEI